jgi:hypothetical protein
LLAKATGSFSLFSGREIGGDDNVLDFLVGHFVDVDLTRQPAS